MLKTTPDDRRKLADELNKLPRWRTGGVNGERAVLLDAGFRDELIFNLPLDGVPTTDATNVIVHLEKIGRLVDKPSHYALGVLVEYLLKNATDKEGQGFLADLLVRYQMINDEAYLKKLRQQYPLPKIPTYASSLKERRIDAAVPDHVEIGQQVELLAQVRFLDSSLLGIEDFPPKQKPDSVEQEAEPIILEFPPDPRTGKPGPGHLEIEVVSPNFEIEGTARQRIEVPPDKFSKRISFLLTATKIGSARINVHVYNLDNVYQGRIPIATTVGGTTQSSTKINVANLNFVVVVAEQQDDTTLTPTPKSTSFQFNIGQVENLAAGENVLQINKATSQSQLHKQPVARDIERKVISMLTNTPAGRQFIAEVSKKVIPQVEPDELPYFDKLITEFLEERKKDVPLGFGLSEMLALTPIVATAVILISMEMFKAIGLESDKAITAALNKKLLQKQDERPTFTPEQIKKIRETTMTQLIEKGDVEKEEAEEITNAVMAELLPSPLAKKNDDEE